MAGARRPVLKFPAPHRHSSVFRRQPSVKERLFHGTVLLIGHLFYGTIFSDPSEYTYPSGKLFRAARLVIARRQ